VVALVLVQCHLGMMLPAEELRTDLRRGMARLEHYLDRAAAERRVQNWEQLAQSGLEAAMYEWESGALWLREQDGEVWREERGRAEAGYRKEVEAAYARWASGRVYSERTGFESSGLEAALREAADVWSYGDSGRTVNLADAGEARRAWELVAAEIVNGYLNGWEEQQGAVYVELEDRFRDLGLSSEEKGALIRGAAEDRRIEMGREYNRIALAEGNRLMTELLYDQGSMKKLAAGEAASVIARELAREAETAVEERSRELFNQLDTMIAAEEQENIELAAEGWLNQFRSVFEEALARWEEAELGFLAARAEWEHDAEDAYLAGEDVWNQAYFELTGRQKAWEAAILSKLDEGFARWQENQSRLATEMENARNEFLAAAAESRKIQERMLESQESIYIRSRQMMNLVSQGIESWFSLWDEKYLKVYTYMKNAIDKENREEDEKAENWGGIWGSVLLYKRNTPLADRFGNLDYGIFKNLLAAADIDDLTNPNKKNAEKLRNQIELLTEACLFLQEKGIPKFSDTEFGTEDSGISIFEILGSIDRLLESADVLINKDTGWLSLAVKYREFADNSARRLYELAGSVAGDSGVYRGELTGELTGELLKAEALLNYWDNEFEVAEALHRYAQETSSAIEDAAKTREDLEKAKEAYNESVISYRNITELVNQKAIALNRTQENFETAQTVLAGLKQEVEEAQREYLNVISAMKEINPSLIYAELAELAKEMLNFWDGKYRTGETTEGDGSLEDTITTYYRLSHEYADILRSLEINSLINALETGSGLGQDGIAALETKAEEARDLSQSGREEDLRAATGIYPADLLLISPWKQEMEEEEDGETEGEIESLPRYGKDLLVEMDRAYHETEDPEEQENLLTLMRRIWEEAVSYYEKEILLRNESIEYLKTGMLPDPAGEGAERVDLIRDRYEQYHAPSQNQKNREAGQRVEQLIRALKEGTDSANTAGEKKALEYAAELRDAGKGLNEQGWDALESFIAAFLEYAAVRDYENGSKSSTDVESRQREYQEAAASYLLYESWSYAIYNAAGLEEIMNSAEFAALPAEDRELFLFYVESEDTLSIYAWIENLRNATLEETKRRADALIYTFYYSGEKEESRFSWVPVLAGHKAGLAASGVNNGTLKMLEPLFAPNVQKTYLEGLEHKMYWIGVWFDKVDEWDQTQYREDADISGAEFARAALETGRQAYQTGINMDLQISLMIQDALEKLRYINKDSEFLEALKRGKENILTAAQKKYNDYLNNEYSAAIRAIDQSCADYNAAVDLADVYYGEMAEARLQLRKKQEIHDWAESIYLKDFGTNYDEYYVTPQEKLVQVRYARDRALIAVEVLQEILGGAPTRPDAAYSQALESYKESRRAYYLAQAASYEAGRAIARQETIVREAELAEEAARNQFVSGNTSVSARSYELVYLVDNGNGTYKPVLAYTLETTLRFGIIPAHNTVKKAGVKIDEAAFRKYFGDTGAVSIEKTGKTETMTLAEWEAGEWLKKMGNRGIDYFNDVILASLYIKFCSAEDSDEGKAWFGNESDPRLNGDYNLGNILLETNFHGIDIKSRFDEAKRAALQEAYNRVMQRSGGEEDIAYYLLYRGRNFAADSITREEDLLKSQAIKKLSESLGRTHENYAVDVKVNTGIAIGYTATGVALAIGAIFIRSLLPLSIQAFSMAAIFYALAGNYEFIRRQIGSLWDDVKNLGGRYDDMINGTNTQFRDKYGAWTEAAARLNTEKEKLNLLYYGSTHNIPRAGEKIPLSYDNFRNSLENMFKNGGANSITFKDAISVYDRALYENSRAETGSTSIGALGILNAALDEKSKKQKDLMDREIERLKGRQQESLGLYQEAVNSALSVPRDRQEELRALALKAGDPSLDIAERREASAEYERLITELCLSTEDLRENIQVLLDRAFGDNSWNSTEHGENIIDLEGELFGTWTLYGRPIESYTENEIVLLKEASLAALDTDTALRLAVKEQEWGLIVGDFLNQYNAWQEQVNQIRQAGLSEWDKARSRMNEGYNNWRKKFSDEYQAKATAWDFNYLEFINEKQLWIEDQYLYAVNVGNSGLFEYTENNADQVIGQALAKLSVERMNREYIDPLEYTNTLLQDSILGELLARMDKLGGRGESGAQKIGTAVKRTSASESLAQASRLIAEMDADMQQAAAKLAAQQAQQLIEDAISQLYDRLDGENRAMLEWEEHLVQSAGYRIDGQIRRQAVVDSALFANYTVTQTVHRYEFYVPDSGPATGVDLNAAAIKDMDADMIMYMTESARLNLDKWGEKIFGRIENNKIMEHPVPHGKNNSSGTPIMVRDGALGAHIGYEPILKAEVSYLNSPLEDAEDPGSGEMGKILLDFLWNGQVSAMGYYEMGRASYDQKFWAKVYTPNFEIPTIRSTANFALDIASIALSGVISPLAASLLTLADDLLFSGLDVGFGYRSTDEVMKNLTSSVASVALSAGFSALGKTSMVKNVTEWASKYKGVNTLLKTGTAAVKSYTTSVATNAIQALNFETGEFDTEGFVKSLYSAQTLSGAVTAMINVGFDGLTDKISNRNQKLFGSLANLGVAGISEASRYGVYAIESMVSGEGSLGERLGQAYENMGGITLNIANLGSILDMVGTLGYGMNGNFNTSLGDLGQKLSGVGLLEMNLGLDGPSFALGTGGIDVAGSLYNTAKHGLNYMTLKYGNYGAQENSDTLVENYLYGDWAAENTSMRIMNGSDILQLVDSTVLGENTMGYTTRQDGNTGRVFNILDMGNADSNAVILQHESHRDGLVTSGNDAETFDAVLAHTKMAIRMLQDTDKTGLEANEMLMNDIAHYLFGGTNGFSNYVSENYDSSGDYWRILLDSAGNVTRVLYDKEYTRATIVYADGTERIEDFEVGESLSGSLAALIGNGMTQTDMNRIMAASGLDYDKENHGGWYAAEERAIYVPPAQPEQENVPPAMEDIPESAEKAKEGFSLGKTIQGVWNSLTRGFEIYSATAFARDKARMDLINSWFRKPEDTAAIEPLLPDLLPDSVQEALPESLPDALLRPEEDTNSGYVKIPGGDSYAFWTGVMTPETIAKYEYKGDGKYSCNEFAQDVIKKYYGMDLFTRIFGSGGDTNTLFDKFKINPNMERIDTNTTSMEGIQAMADNGILIFLIYKNLEAGQKGHIAFIANSRLAMTTMGELSDIGKTGTELDKNIFWPIVAQGGYMTGISSTVYATNGFSRSNYLIPGTTDPIPGPFRPYLLKNNLHFYTVKGGTN
jgi:hypothetical protein